ncbi:unnamed protein product, partial [Meganyctiphanes norvegica]
MSVEETVHTLLVLTFEIEVLSVDLTRCQSCLAGTCQGKRTSKTRLNVWMTPSCGKFTFASDEGAKIIEWSHFESEYTLGLKIVFQCSAEGDPRPHITWFKNGLELYGHAFFMTHEWDMGEKGKKSKMEIDPATHMDAGYYECMADNQYAVDVKGFSTDFSLEFE